MPFVEINLLRGRTELQKKKMVEAVTAAIETTTNAKRENISIVIRDVDAEDWARGGILFSENKPN